MWSKLEDENTAEPNGDMFSIAGSRMCELTNHSRLLGFQEWSLKDKGAKTECFKQRENTVLLYDSIKACKQVLVTQNKIMSQKN